MHRQTSLLIAFAALGCGGASVPFPTKGPEPSAMAFEEVPDAPPPPRPEIIRPTSVANAVWVDGQWERVDGAWRFTRGGWVVPPTGARFTAFRVRRAADGTLLFAAARWIDVSGQTIEVERMKTEGP